MHWYIYSSVLKKIKFKSEIGIYLRFHNEYQKQVYLADKSPTTTSDLYQNSVALKMNKQLEFREWDFCYIPLFLKYKYVQCHFIKKEVTTM